MSPAGLFCTNLKKAVDNSPFGWYNNTRRQGRHTSYGGLAQLGARLVSKHTPSQIVLRHSNSQQKTPSKRFASWILWGISSAGRALAWHARGQRFDPAILHQKSTVLRLKFGAFLFAFLEVTLKISQMPDFAGAWTATPNSCCFVIFENSWLLFDARLFCRRTYHSPSMYGVKSKLNEMLIWYPR